MNIRKRVLDIERKLRIDCKNSYEDAKSHTDALLRLGRIKPEEYDEKLKEVIESGLDTKKFWKDILDAISGRSLGLPSERRWEKGGSNGIKK